MKSIVRYLSVIIVAAALSMSTAFAGECCKETAAKVKAGELCPKCMKADAPMCCKKTAEKAMKSKDAKMCKTCMEKSKEKESKEQAK